MYASVVSSLNEGDQSILDSNNTNLQGYILNWLNQLGFGDFYF